MDSCSSVQLTSPTLSIQITGHVNITLTDPREDVSSQRSPEPCVVLEMGREPLYRKTWKQQWHQQLPPRLTGGWTFITHSIASVCRAVVCLMFDTVGWVQFGWAGVSTFTFAPRDFYWGDRKHTSVKLSRVIFCTKSYLVGVYVGVQESVTRGQKQEMCVSKKIPGQLATLRLQPEPNACLDAMSDAVKN